MGKFDAAEVIKAAATSNLGVISLIVLVLAFLAWRFFQQSSDKVKLVAFATMFLGAAGFVAAAMRAGGDSPKSEAKHAIAPVPVTASPAPDVQLPSEDGAEAGIPDIAGAWHDTDGYSYALHQDGDAFTYKVSLKGETAGRGAGTIAGSRLTYRYTQVDGGQGTCEGKVAASGRTISGRCRDGSAEWQFVIER
jgi:hypothetical protein